MNEQLWREVRKRFALFLVACAIAAAPLIAGTAIAQIIEGGDQWIEITPNGWNCNDGCGDRQVCC